MATMESDAAAPEEHEEFPEGYPEAHEEFPLAETVHVPHPDPRPEALPTATAAPQPPPPPVPAPAPTVDAPPAGPAKSTQEERRAQICRFLSRFVDPKRGALERGATTRAAEEFDTNVRAIYKIWARHKNAILHPDKYKLDVRRKKGSGRTFKRTPEELRALVKSVPCRYRHSLRTLSERLGIPRTTLHTFLKNDDSLYRSVGARADDEDGEGAGGTAPRPPPGDDDPLHRDAQKELELNSLRRTEARRIRAELREHYEAEKERAVEEAKREARERHDRHLEELHVALRQQFDSEKERVLYQLRVEMHRHSLELNRLKGELDKIGRAKKGDEAEEEKETDELSV